MNYLFYLGIIVPTLITICLFVVFIYCWFLQKARKEVLTQRYDPHGKMRRLGLSMEPPPPPDFCRMEPTATTPLAARLSPAIYGEDNMAYCVSRSPSTEQQQQQQQQHRRSLYHTYHDSGISAGGLAALTSSTLDSEREMQEVGARPVPRSDLGGGMAYRTCPDSGISGLSGGFYGAAEAAVHGAPSCAQLGCHVQDHEQIWYEEQQPQRHSLYHQQQHQHMRPQHLHHTLVQASVHPSHGMCYGDNTNHPQSPQHYTPPPQQQRVHRQERHDLHNTARPDQVHQIQMAAHVHYPPTSPRRGGSGICSPRRCSDDDQVFELVSPTASAASYLKDIHGHDLATETSFGPQGAMDIMVTPCGDPRIANTSLPAQQTIVLSCLVQQQQQQQLQNLDSAIAPHHQHQKTHPHKNTPTTMPKSSSSSSCTPPRPSHHRDSGVPDDSSGASTDQSGGSSSSNTTITSSERPDSQASHSPSTTDSEDSGFRGSHCPTSMPPAPNTRLNKQTNPLLKPLRRPRTKNARKNNASGQGNNSSSAPQREASKIANTDSSAPGSPTPLVILDPQNLTPPPLSDIAGLGRGLEMVDMSGRGGGPAPHVTSDSSPHLDAQASWSDEPNPRCSNDKAVPSVSSGGGALGDISTHLSWNYLQGLPSAQISGASPHSARAVSGASGGSRQLGQDLHHIDVLGYSVV